MFRYYGKGVVTKDNSEGKTIIEVSPIEIIRDMKGPITSMKKDFKNSIKATGGVSGTTTTADYILEPIWFSMNSERTTPPYVVAGEEVILLHIPNTEVYFWAHIGDKNLRKLEIIKHIYSNKEKALEPKELDATNSVESTINTIDQKLSITTPKNRGEPMTWLIDLNYKDAILTVENSAGDLVEIQGIERHIQVRTKTVEIDAITTTFTGDVIIYGTLTAFKNTLLKAALRILGSTSAKAIKATSVSKSSKNIGHGMDHFN